MMIKLMAAGMLLVLLVCACEENGIYPGVPVDNESAIPSVPGQDPGVPAIPGPGTGAPAWMGRPPRGPGDNMSRPEIPGMPGSPGYPGGLLPSSLPAADAPTAIAVTKLSAQSGIPAADVILVSAEKVTWGDTSLGLPAPGVMYAQVVVPGYKITLQAGGNAYIYHAGWQGQRWTVMPAIQDRSGH